MTAFAGLLRKELLTFVTNRTFVVLVALPALIAVLFNLAFSTERPVATVALVPPADAALAQRVRTDLASFSTLRLGLVTEDLGAAKDAATRGRVSDVIDASGLRVDGGAVAGGVVLIVDELRPVSAQVVEATVAEWATRLGGSRPAVRVDVAVVRGVSPRQATIPLWLVTITLVIAISSLPLGLVEERELKTLRALLLAPVPRATILAAKGLVALAMILVMCALVVVLNGVQVRDLALLGCGLVCGAVAFVPLGLAIGAFSPNQSAFGPFGGLLLVGLLLPVALLQTEAGTITTLAQVLPSGALAAVVRGATISNVGFAEYVPQLGYLVVFGIVSSALAIWAIGRESVMMS